MLAGLATLLSACFARGEESPSPGHVETTILDGQVTVCTDARLSENSRGMIAWSKAASPAVEDIRALVTPRGGSFNASNNGEYGKVAERLNLKFCADNIPKDAVAYSVSGKPGNLMTDAEREVYDSWRDGNLKTGPFASEDVYVVDGKVVHINILAIER